MSKEYIEKEAVLSGAHRFRNNFGAPQEAVSANYIRSIPPADVKPVVRGMWLTKEYMYGDPAVGIEDKWVERRAEDGDEAYCSECGGGALLDGGENYVLSPICPHCGADMEGGGKWE